MMLQIKAELSLLDTEWCHLTHGHHSGTLAWSAFQTRVAESQQHVVSAGGGLRGDVGINTILTVCCSHCHCSRQSVMAIGQCWLADDDGYDTSTPYYHSSVYGWYNGFVWWVRFLSTLHLLHRADQLRSLAKAPAYEVENWSLCYCQ